jgi:formamidopyrimidine-DNA glycosylase
MAASEKPSDAAIYLTPMPELPEVETIVRSLRNPADWTLKDSQPMNARPGVVGRGIGSVQLLWPRTLATPDVQRFTQRLIGQTIQQVGRRGKFIVISFEQDTLLIHLRMSGDLRVENQTADLLPHDRLKIDFIDGVRLVFNDTRKFGRVWLVEDPQIVLNKLGPEPLDPTFLGVDLYERLHKSARSVKTLLLDQSLIAGIGNIYSDEALHRARIHPSTPGKALTLEQSEHLLTGIREVLEEGIRRNGASIDWVYRGGDFQNHFRVYQRTGQACLVCGTPIERRVIGQRSSHFCPVCQPEIKKG